MKTLSNLNFTPHGKLFNRIRTILKENDLIEFLNEVENKIDEDYSYQVYETEDGFGDEDNMRELFLRNINPYFSYDLLDRRVTHFYLWHLTHIDSDSLDLLLSYFNSAIIPYIRELRGYYANEFHLLEEKDDGLVKEYSGIITLEKI